MKKLATLISIIVVLSALAACVAPAAAPAPAQPAAPAAAQPTAAAAAPAAAAPTTAPAPAASGKPLNFTTVVKIAGINWFNRMETGVTKWGKDSGVNATLVGPAQADAAQQIPIIEDLIAKKVDALCVVPMDPAQLDPVLKKAMDAGIIVVTHEASNQKNMNFDIEAFDNKAFGAGLMDRLAASMGEEGEYAVFVGSLGSKTHNEWVDGGIAEQKAKYPKMTLVGDKNESFDDADKAYAKAKEVLKAHPNIKGFQGSASTDVAGIGRAVEEAGLSGKVSVVGTSLPSIAGDLMKTGAIDAIGFWDPAVAGAACNKIALMLKNGEKVGEGTDLGIAGYNKLKAVGNVLYGDAAVYVDAKTMDQYPF
jgi:simple sugar transport system substrate-binding protein